MRPQLRAVGRSKAYFVGGDLDVKTWQAMPDSELRYNVITKCSPSPSKLLQQKRETYDSMDPFSSEGGSQPISFSPTTMPLLTAIPELLNIQNAFYQGQYQNVIAFDTSSLSPENALTSRILQLRARIASGQADDVIAEVEGEEEVPDLAAVKALAQRVSGDASAALEVVEHLMSFSPENATVQLLGATVLQAEGRSEDALTLLAKHQGNLEA